MLGLAIRPFWKGKLKIQRFGNPVINAVFLLLTCTKRLKQAYLSIS